jgi:multicomponent Na+:H+ antiporter subunit E
MAKIVESFKQDLFKIIFLTIVWVGISGDFDKFAILRGCVFSLVITLFMNPFKHKKKQPLIKKLKIVCIYFPIILISFCIRVVISILNVAYSIVTMKINPRIVQIETVLTSDDAITLLGNMITLTPGTLTVDTTKKGDHAYFQVHWLCAKNIPKKDIKAAIIGDMDKWFKEVFE